MSQPYVPPFRAKAQGQSQGGQDKSLGPKATSNSILDEDLRSHEEIGSYFWPDGDPSWKFRMQKTLHDAASAPGTLAYVLLFKGANPRWEQDCLIFAKSDLHYLPQDLVENLTPAARTSVYGKTVEEDDTDKPKPTPNATSQPIAVFSQSPTTRKTKRIFTFAGWYYIARIEFLEPRSPELARMLDHKWTTVNARGQAHQKVRLAEGWNASFRLRWAVIKFEKDDLAEKERGAPEIAKLESDDGDTKTVNEMLRELRMQSEEQRGQSE